MSASTKKCPMCAEQIPLEATVCEYCGTKFDVTVEAGQSVSRVLEEPVAPPKPPAQTIPHPMPAAAPKQTTPWVWIAAGLGLLLVIALVGGGVLIAQNSLPFLATPTSTPRPTLTPRPQPQPTYTPAIQEFTFSVPANAIWYDTGIQIHKGQIVEFTASGEICTWVECSFGDIPGPNGGDAPCQFLDNSACLMDGARYGALIGKIGNGDPFLIGSSLGLMASEDGTLHLAVNDNLIYYDDNSGSYLVTIKLDESIGFKDPEMVN